MIWFWRIVFLLTVVAYIVTYAPYGINETDGGFLTGLAWQTLSGKTLFNDIVYVRPPLPVWLRALELQYLPENWAILGERWIFYLKIAIYSLLGCNVLSQGIRMWQMACFAFVISAHCYPAAAWHTVDGIFFGVFGVWFFQKSLHQRNPHDVLFAVYGSLFILMAMLCKQSFYPLIVVPFLYASRIHFNQKSWISILVLLVSAQLFFYYLLDNQLLTNYIKWTSSASSFNDAFQCGFVDYFRINVWKVFFFAAMFNFIGYFKHQKMGNRTEKRILMVLLAGFPLGYLYFVLKNQSFTVPFHESRMLFWLALAALFQPFLQIFDLHNLSWQNFKLAFRSLSLPLLSLSLITWCSAISWGYNLPIFFTVPGVYGMFLLLHKVDFSIFKFKNSKHILTFFYFLLVAFVFNQAYQNIYRDGKRAEMTQHLGDIFPSLKGIYSDFETSEKYCELKELSSKYGQNTQVMPAFPQAKFLLKNPPILPLDWTIKVETANDGRILGILDECSTTIFFEKSYSEEIEESEAIYLTKIALDKRQLVEETTHFKVYTCEN
jgi:hypothetical protein